MRTEPLGSGVEVFVTDENHFSTDTILLAHFAAVKNGERVFELGTGCGTIPLLMIREHTPQSVTALDIQEEAIEMLTQSIAHNLAKGIERASLIRPVLGDIREVSENFPAGECDLVVCNPPYKLDGTGIKSPIGAKNIALHETQCTLDDICKAAKRLLRFGCAKTSSSRRSCALYRAERTRRRSCFYAKQSAARSRATWTCSPP